MKKTDKNTTQRIQLTKGNLLFPLGGGLFQKNIHRIYVQSPNSTSKSKVHVQVQSSPKQLMIKLYSTVYKRPPAAILSVHFQVLQIHQDFYTPTLVSSSLAGFSLGTIYSPVLRCSPAQQRPDAATTLRARLFPIQVFRSQMHQHLQRRIAQHTVELGIVFVMVTRNSRAEIMQNLSNDFVKFRFL